MASNRTHKVNTAVVDGDEHYAALLGDSLKIFFGDAVKTALTNPAQAYFFLRTLRWQKQAAATRRRYADDGVHVPPIMLYSVTNRCNLHCRGCYHQALRGGAGEELPGEKVKSVVAEARDLGISFMVLAGGEPLVRPETLEIAAANPQVLFLIFTNGLLIDDEVARKLKSCRNVIPIISVEGFETETDWRRGAGVSSRLERVMARLKENRIFWGTSTTVTRENYPTVTRDTFVSKLNHMGCKMFFFVEYSPVRAGTEGWVIGEVQRSNLAVAMEKFRSRHSALFISVPGDEGRFGGCLAAGRGFVHVSADGNVEPCPFVPFSDANVMKVSLKEALQSKFLAKVRGNSDKLEEGTGGCSLWKEREWLSSLLDADAESLPPARPQYVRELHTGRLPGDRLVRITRHNSGVAVG